MVKYGQVKKSHAKRDGLLLMQMVVAVCNVMFSH